MILKFNIISSGLHSLTSGERLYSAPWGLQFVQPDGIRMASFATCVSFNLSSHKGHVSFLNLGEQQRVYFFPPAVIVFFFVSSRQYIYAACLLSVVPNSLSPLCTRAAVLACCFWKDARRIHLEWLSAAHHLYAHEITVIKTAAALPASSHNQWGLLRRLGTEVC